MEKITMEANVREGKTTAKKLKRDGKVPAVIYGKETKTMSVEIKVKDIEKTVRTLSEGTILITLKLTDKDKQEEKIVSIKEVRRDPATEEIIHADFHQIGENEMGKFQVPIVGEGVPEGVKMGGVLELFTRTLKIKCKPADLPEKYIINIKHLNVGDEIRVKDMDPGPGVEILSAPEVKLFVVKGARKVVEEAPVEAAADAPKEPVSDHGGPKEEEKKEEKK